MGNATNTVVAANGSLAYGPVRPGSTKIAVVIWLGSLLYVTKIVAIFGGFQVVFRIVHNIL